MGLPLAVALDRNFETVGFDIDGALLPRVVRGPILPGTMFEPASVDTLIGNMVAIVIAFWMRLSIETYPGIRRSYVIFPSALTGHGLTIVYFILTRFPYDRVGLLAGFLPHVTFLYLLYVYAERGVRRRIAVVPFGTIDQLTRIRGVDWHVLKRPRLHDARSCNAIVADFSADLPDEWEAFLADAALDGRIVYQVKQLAESLTGRVELEHLTESSSGCLLPARGYFHLKGLIDFLFALLILPLALPVMAACAIAIRLDSSGPALFRQNRIGHAGRSIIVYRFRTMHRVEAADQRSAAMTKDGEDRITPVGGAAKPANRRAAANHQHPEVGNELDQPGGTDTLDLVYRRDPLLSLPPCREAGDFGLSAGESRSCRRGRRGSPQAAV